MINTKFRDTSVAILPYMASLYYLEILNLLVVLSLVAGKVISFELVFISAVLLAVHLVKLSERRELNRRIQLVLMVFHVPYIASIIAGTLWNHLPLTTTDRIFLAIRGVMAVMESAYIIILTDPATRSIFSEGQRPSPFDQS